MSSAQIIKLFKEEIAETINMEPVEGLEVHDLPSPEFINITALDLNKVKMEAYEQGYQKAKAEAKLESIKPLLPFETTTQEHLGQSITITWRYNHLSL